MDGPGSAPGRRHAAESRDARKTACQPVGLAGISHQGGKPRFFAGCTFSVLCSVYKGPWTHYSTRRGCHAPHDSDRLTSKRSSVESGTFVFVKRRFGLLGQSLLRPGLFRKLRACRAVRTVAPRGLRPRRTAGLLRAGEVLNRVPRAGPWRIQARSLAGSKGGAFGQSRREAWRVLRAEPLNQSTLLRNSMVLGC